MTEDRRKSIRIKKPITVQYGYQVNNKIFWDMSLLKDISDTGLCIGTNRSFAKGENFILKLRLPLKPFESLDLDSKVVESNMTQSGSYITRVEFTNPTEKDKELIREYVAWTLIKERGEK